MALSNVMLILKTAGQKSIQYVVFQVMFINFFDFPAIKNIHVIIKELKMLLSIAANRTKGKLKHGRNEEI